MARVLPSFIHKDTPPGEKTVFSLLKNDQTTDDWVVLHSYNLPRHKKRMEGEIDFLILIPNKGVLVLEVKSHGSVARRNGMWRMGNDSPTSRGPFEQASEAMYSLKKELGPEFTQGVPFTYAVAFTSLTFYEQATEWQPWQVIDESSMTGSKLVRDLENVLDQHRSQLNADKSNPDKRHSVGWFNPADQLPKKADVDKIVKRLRGDFERFADLQQADAHKQTEYHRFLTEQFEAIDAMDGANSVFFEGPAGTGKTFLAIEAARRAVQRNERVLLVCYNRLLGRFLKEQVVTNEGFVGTVNSLLWHHPLLKKHVTQNHNDFLAASAEATQQDVFRDQFDAIIVDEVQDLCAVGADATIKVIAEQNPHAEIRLFGDFQNQDIQLGPRRAAVTDQLVGRESLLKSFPQAVPYRLTRNCRNRPGVGKVIEYTTGLDSLYTGYRLPDTRDSFELVNVEGDPSPELYESVFQRLSKIFLPSRIAILGCSREVAVDYLPPKLQRFFTNVVDSWSPMNSLVLSTTVRKFKGMDAQAVILTNLPDDLDTSLLYTGISRAIERVVIVCPKRLTAELAKRLTTKAPPHQGGHSLAEQ